MEEKKRKEKKKKRKGKEKEKERKKGGEKLEFTIFPFLLSFPLYIVIC